MCKICAFSPKKPTKRRTFYISRRSWYEYKLDHKSCLPRCLTLNTNFSMCYDIFLCLLRVAEDYLRFGKDVSGHPHQPTLSCKVGEEVKPFFCSNKPPPIFCWIISLLICCSSSYIFIPSDPLSSKEKMFIAPLHPTAII